MTQDLFITTNKEVHRYYAKINKLSCYHVVEWLDRIGEALEKGQITLEEIPELLKHTRDKLQSEGALWEAREAML